MRTLAPRLRGEGGAHRASNGRMMAGCSAFMRAAEGRDAPASHLPSPRFGGEVTCGTVQLLDEPGAAPPAAGAVVSGAAFASALGFVT